jgi:S-formylglutathione hydrolase
MGRWTEERVGGHPADWFTPAGTQRPKAVVVFLHGQDQASLQGRRAFEKALDAHALACVCPWGGPGWWADRVCPAFDPKVTPERHLLDRVLPTVQAYWGVGPPKLGLLGIGMGGQGALRLAFKHPRLFPAVAALAAEIEYHQLYGQGTPLDDMYTSKEQCRQDTASLHVHPANYPPHIFFAANQAEPFWFRGNDRLHEKLTALGVEHTAELAPPPAPPGQAFADSLADRAVHFLHLGLTAQSRRLL